MVTVFTNGVFFINDLIYILLIIKWVVIAIFSRDLMNIIKEEGKKWILTQPSDTTTGNIVRRG